MSRAKLWSKMHLITFRMKCCRHVHLKKCVVRDIQGSIFLFPIDIRGLFHGPKGTDHSPPLIPGQVSDFSPDCLFGGGHWKEVMISRPSQQKLFVAGQYVLYYAESVAPKSTSPTLFFFFFLLSRLLL